ncbi:MAG: hypothetical protein LBV47_07855 [Bacteroidales bacterium]|jgi:hypothetical protein|nr:hypothetical protein [Bacteroidales bacterium]
MGLIKSLKKNGFKTNINYFSQSRDSEGLKQHDLEAIKISVYMPVDTVKKDWPENLLQTNSDLKNVKRREINIYGLNVVQTVYYTDFIDTNCKVEQLYNCSYFFEKNNVFIEFTISSRKDNFIQYHSALKKMIRSFELKN